MEEYQSFEQEAESLFGTMRDATPEEIESIQSHLDRISKPTGFNIFDIIDGGE